MESTLTIKDLCASNELDREAMSAVWGGFLRHESVHAELPRPEQTLSPPGGFGPNGSVFGADPI